MTDALPPSGVGEDAAVGGPLSAGQQRFYRHFGFVVVRGFYSPEQVARLQDGFDAAFADGEPMSIAADNEYHANNRGPSADGAGETETDTGYLHQIITPFAEAHDHLCWLTDDERLLAAAAQLLPIPAFLGSTGDRLNCDVFFHADVYNAPINIRHTKFLIYLDPQDRDHGALRVLPGTHLHQTPYARALRSLCRDPSQVPDVLGAGGPELPATVLETEPGDLIINDYRTLHASFGGRPGRRLITLNYRDMTDQV